MYIILEYSQEDFARLEERAFINSKGIGEYIRKVTEYPCNTFSSWKATDSLGEKPAVTKPRKRHKARVKKGA